MQQPWFLQKDRTHDILSNLKKIPCQKNICVLKIDEYVMSFLKFCKNHDCCVKGYKFNSIKKLSKENSIYVDFLHTCQSTLR